MKIQPSLYNAYHICRREAWLMYHQVTGDQMNEFMYIGRLLSEDTFQRKKHEIMLADLPAKVDMIETRNGELMIAEIKKSSKRYENGKLQLKYYLYLLHQKGYKIKGEIKIPKEKKREIIELDEEDIAFVEKSLIEIEKLVQEELPPEPKRIKDCAKCAHYEFCFS